MLLSMRLSLYLVLESNYTPAINPKGTMEIKFYPFCGEKIEIWQNYKANTG